MSTVELDQKIQDVFKRIEKERKFIDASRLIRQATTNPDVLRQNDAKVREAERSLSYFEDTLRELQARKLQRDDPSRSGTATSPHQQLFKPGRSLIEIAHFPESPPLIKILLVQLLLAPL
jgi:hypothetical protein